MQSRLSLFTEYAELDSECWEYDKSDNQHSLIVFIDCTESDSLYLLNAQSQTLCIYWLHRVRLSVFIAYAESDSLYLLNTQSQALCIR